LPQKAGGGEDPARAVAATALELANCETASALNQGDDGLSHDPSLVAACKEERAKARGPQFLIGAALTGVTELVGARSSLANTRHGALDELALAGNRSDRLRAVGRIGRLGSGGTRARCCAAHC
jgi:hypothetical protein